ncbi:hypothetical protein DsansV1_C26g0192381 [Dioscorea sansibarensis]
MDWRRASMYNSHLCLVMKESLDVCLYRVMTSLWFHFTASLFFLFGFIAKHLFRINRENDSQVSEIKETKEEKEEEEEGEEEVSEFCFKFEYQVSEDEKESRSSSVITEINKYQFLSENDFSGFFEEPEVKTIFHVQESSAVDDDLQQQTMEAVLEELKLKFNSKELLEEALCFKKQKKCNSETSLCSDGTEFISEEFSGFDSDSESSTSDGYSVKNLVVDSDSDGFLSERDFGGDSDVEKEEFKEYALKKDAPLQFSSSFDSDIFRIGIDTGIGGRSSCSSSKTPPTDHSVHSEELWSDDESCDHFIELKQLKGLKFIASSDDELFSFRNEENSLKDDARETKRDKSNDNVEKKPEEINSKNLDDEEFDALESLWEHQDLIEQLRMELRKARATGLPTILEESESPKTIEVPQPLKIDGKFLREDPIDELHKFYKSYRERMRKFDILNYQKMYAIGFLQLKDPLQSLASQAKASIVFQNLWPFRHRKGGDDLSKKFIKDLQSDLETVYVGQTCLSWEFLRWQYEKARELPESDPHWNQQYNQVAGEFQQFQVLIHRFLENESFQGPRLSNYVKNRCILRNLLQVPVIREDCMKDKIEEQKKGSYVITSELLEEIMEESIRVLWEFIKADKDETPVILKGLIGSQVELQDPSDYEILVNAQKILQKKEKKLKDILRTGNCIVKKFKKAREDRSNQELFFSQIDMKLVARVLKMSRLTSDQLLWCHKKLSKITFSERKVDREPAFLLFPC